MQNDLTPEAKSAIERIKKLLALAQNNDNEHQAGAASAKAMELMEQYNLDMAVLGKSGKGQQGAPRDDKKEKGGLYGWQRDLWKAAAGLNMCMYWSLKGQSKGAVYEHRLLGSEVNVLATRLLAEYLQGTVERLAQAWAKEQGYKSCFVREAIAYREGMAKRLTERLEERRKQKLEEDAAKAREEAARAKHPSAAPGTGLVLADVIQSEDDLNNDHLRGWEPGTTARLKAEQKARYAYAASRKRLWETDKARFMEVYSAEDVEEMEAADERRKKSEADWALYVAGKWSETYGKPSKPRASRSTGGRYRYRAETAAEQRAGLASYQEGHRKGNDIGLDKQVDKSQREGIG
jgi:hypothetical protein